MEPVRLSDLAVQLDAELIGDGDVMISGAAGLEHAGAGDITFVARGGLLEALARSSAAAVIVGADVEPDRPALRVKEPYQTFARILARVATPLDRIFPPGIHETAIIAEDAEIGTDVCFGPGSVIAAGCKVGNGVRLGANVVLEPDVVVGAGSVLYANAVVRERCTLGQRVILHPGCVIGADGFGYLPGPRGLEKIPQVGLVIIGDDVELGACTCVDRATTGVTEIKAGSKLDNMVQVGHNVVIGNHSVFSAQTGIAGSCEIGNGVTMGGQVGLGDHVKIGNGVKIGGKSGVHNDVPDGSAVFGYIALEARESMRIISAWRRLPEMVKTMAKLERDMKRLENGDKE